MSSMTRSFDRNNWNQPPHNRASFQTMQSLFPTARIKRSEQPTGFEIKEKDLSEIPYVGVGGKQHTVKDMLDSNLTDAFLVLHDGKIIAEQYHNHMQRSSVHLVNSVTKTYTGMLAGILVAEGTIDLDAKVTHYIDEFSNNALSEATVTQVLDMTAGVAFSEHYASLNDDFWQETATIGWRPDLESPDSPKTLFEYALRRTEMEGDDGHAFHYRTLLTNVIAMIIERASGQPVPDLLESKIWQKLGCETDGALVVDPSGFPYMGAGLSASTRDLARFGEVLRNKGAYNGHQVIPESWVQSTMNGSDHLRQLFADSDYSEVISGGHYSNQTWAHQEMGILMCIGIHGQVIVANQNSGAVVVVLSTHEAPADDYKFAELISCAVTLSAAVDVL